jgi:Transposase
MRLQTILNRVEKFKSFADGEAHFEEQAGGPALVVQVLPRKNSLPYGSGCLRRGRPYDHLKQRRFEFVPLWGILVFLAYRKFWEYRGASWAGKFLDEWTRRVLRSRLEPMKRVARTLRNHRPLILNWFRAKGAVSSGAVEGLNNKVKLVTRKLYGFRTARVAKLALLHNLGRLPEPKHTHRFC